MLATYVEVTPSLPSRNPNASRTDESWFVQLTRTDKETTRMAGHDDNPATSLIVV